MLAAGHQEIPCVYSLHKMSDTFQVPRPPSGSRISCQLCFILDYTANMKTQISQTKDAWRENLGQVSKEPGKIHGGSTEFLLQPIIPRQDTPCYYIRT